MGQEEDLELYRSRLLESLNGRSSRCLLETHRIPFRFISTSAVWESLKEGGSARCCKFSASITSTRCSFALKRGFFWEGSLLPSMDLERTVSGFPLIRSSSVSTTPHRGERSARCSAPRRVSGVESGRVSRMLTDGLTPAVRIRRCIAYGMRTVAFTQALLAIAVVGLVADRMMIWMTPEPTPSPVVQTATSRCSAAGRNGKTRTAVG